MKTFVTYLALVGFTSVSVVSVVRAVRTEMRRGPAFDAAALGAWLVTPSREDESPITLRRAARQLEQEFHDQYNRRSEYQSLDKLQRRTFEANWRRLLIILVRQQADAYAATPKHLRNAFINQRLAQFATWYVFDDGVKMGAASFLAKAKNIDAPGVHLRPEESARIKLLADDLQTAALKRLGGAIAPGFGTTGPEDDDR